MLRLTMLLSMAVLALTLPDDARAQFAARTGAAPAGNGARALATARFPNVILTNQDGERVRFYDDLVRDKVVLVNFIYTSCTAMCPMETARVQQVQRQLGERVGKDVFLYSISVDPANDTPGVLKEYARRFGAGPGWQFLTGDADDVNLLMTRLGLYTADLKPVSATERGDHPISLVMGNERTNRWIKRSVMDDPEVLAELLGHSLHNYSVPRPAGTGSYAQATRLAAKEPGELTFRVRCATCHTLGGGDSVGPDLADVMRRRDRDWLVRYVSNPERLRVEGDPIALELRSRYGNAIMPGLQLPQEDVDAVLSFIAGAGRSTSSPAGEATAR